MLRPSTASLTRNPKKLPRRADGQICAAEFRGPGIRNQFEENPDDYDLEMERSRAFSTRSGRIILLGDGTEVIPDQNEEELFDQTEDHQVQPTDPTRNSREDTPGPQGKQEGTSAQISESPASTDDKDKATAS